MEEHKLSRLWHVILSQSFLSLNDASCAKFDSSALEFSCFPASPFPLRSHGHISFQEVNPLFKTMSQFPITGSDLLILGRTLIGCVSQEFAMYPLPAVCVCGVGGWGGREQPIHFVSPENRSLKSALGLLWKPIVSPLAATVTLSHWQQKCCSQS